VHVSPSRAAAWRIPPLNARGFTLIELVVVLATIGILIFILAGGERWISEWMEQTKADAARATMKEIGLSNRMHLLDHGVYVTGKVNNQSRLVRKGYLAKRWWPDQPYQFEGAASASKRECIVAQAKRRDFGPKGTRVSPYKDWVFCLSRDGRVGSSLSRSKNAG